VPIVLADQVGQAIAAVSPSVLRKMGDADDAACLAQVRAATARRCVDANGG
jgi:hypothetical protein